MKSVSRQAIHCPQLKKSRKYRYWSLVALFLLGVVLTASEGPWFPLLNMGGIVVIATTSFLATLLSEKPFS